MRKPSSGHKLVGRRDVSHAVVYRGAGAPLLGDNPPDYSREQADFIIDTLLGRAAPHKEES